MDGHDYGPSVGHKSTILFSEAAFFDLGVNGIPLAIGSLASLARKTSANHRETGCYLTHGVAGSASESDSQNPGCDGGSKDCVLKQCFQVLRSIKMK